MWWCQWWLQNPNSFGRCVKQNRKIVTCLCGQGTTSLFEEAFLLDKNRFLSTFDVDILIARLPVATSLILSRNSAFFGVAHVLSANIDFYWTTVARVQWWPWVLCSETVRWRLRLIWTETQWKRFVLVFIVQVSLFHLRRRCDKRAHFHSTFFKYLTALDSNFVGRSWPRRLLEACPAVSLSF